MHFNQLLKVFFVTCLLAIGVIFYLNVQLYSLSCEVENIAKQEDSKKKSEVENIVKQEDAKKENLNENHYNAEYWANHKALNEFGSHYKGDLLNALIPKNAESVIEFGSNGGYIINALPYPVIAGIEINPSSVAYSRKMFPDVTVYNRVNDIPHGTKFDVVYSSSVIEHTNSPLQELQALTGILKPGGMFILGVRNDGYDQSQDFSMYANKVDTNYHIFTWNPLLLANLLDSAGFIPCNVITRKAAWFKVDVNLYLNDKYKYCNDSFRLNTNYVENIWAIAVLPQDKHLCREYKKTLNQIKSCEYLKDQ